MKYSSSLEADAARGQANPFAVRSETWPSILRQVRCWTPRQLRAGLPHSSLRAALLARAHADATAWVPESGRPARKRAPVVSGILEDAAFAPLLERAELQRQDVERVAAAAGRCYRALGRLRGLSEPMRILRETVWAACFGRSLEDALGLERIIRDHDVLILGESGTGKERVAMALVEGTMGTSSGADPPPSAALNAAAIPDSLLESELFGHVKGAFTGAAESRRGRIRAADGGCFFLDEVGDVPPTTQVKLLRVIETDQVHPVGSDEGHQVDVRYVAATHRPLEELISRNEFRQDLYQRLAGTVIVLPPLRDRPEDIVEIGGHFLDRHAAASDAIDRARIDGWLRSTEARTHDWPGNVRELENALRNLMLGLPPRLSSRSPSIRAHLPERIQRGDAPLSEVEDWYIRKVLDDAAGNHTEAGRRLGIHRATVKRRTER